MTEAEFVELLDSELGIQLEITDLGKDVDELTEWDSVYLVRLLSVLESRTGNDIPFSELLETRTLGGVRELAVRGA